MNSTLTPEAIASRVLFRGIHLPLTAALIQAAHDKAARLFRHEEQIIRLRIDLEHAETTEANLQFTAKGHLEISGPDLVATVASDDAYKSLDLLVDKLDGLLRRRHGRRVNTRNDPE